MENHFIQLENKTKLTVTDVVSVEAFDEETILVNLQTEGTDSMRKGSAYRSTGSRRRPLVCIGENLSRLLTA